MPVPAPAVDVPAARAVSIAAHAPLAASGHLTAVQAASVQRLQRTYGNQAVQRLVRQAGGSPVIQRWHDDGHVQTTKQAVETVDGQSGGQLSATFGGREGGKPMVLKDRLADASLNMDRFFPQVFQGKEKESHNVGRLPTLAAFVTGMAWSQLKRLGPGGQGRSRGLFGEGANHGEAGMYTQWSGAEAKNLARENQFVDQAIVSYMQGDLTTALNRLGDASHVAADRGSHGEGHKGRGHDTPMPPEGKSGHRFTPLTQQQTDDDYDYMESWEDNDDMSKNPDGYSYGLQRTIEMFERFLARVPERWKTVSSKRQGTESTD